MQKGIRVNDSQLTYLATKARQDNTMCGHLEKKSTDTGRWVQRWFAIYQNLLFYFENECVTKSSGVWLLEGSYCERLFPNSASKGKDSEKQHCFSIKYRNECQKQYDLRAETEHDCYAWIEAILQASYSKLLEQKEQLEQKHLHLLQILDSERQAKWHYVQQTDELTLEVKKLKNEVTSLKLQILREFKRERKISNDKVDEENEELRKIKKVQSFFRGWLCRRRWKQIVEEYIRSDHAESMRKRNSIVFGMVECEEEYVKQIATLVSVFLRPFRMAASSKKPPITHEDVNSIFLNSETLLFLHQIFLKGLMARMENWPTLVLGDLFDMLLPMLGIYQEYVRNHHYSLQVLAEYKQKAEFNELLRRYEEKTICEGRTLETFLTYPMHQIPRYIITIHELLAHTPHDHVERKSLEFAQGKLEELSQIMQDEVSETENIRKNLAIERMIVEGCDILLDVNQTFVRQGGLLQIYSSKQKTRLGASKKDTVRQVFLFTNHILLTTRASNGRLHLAKQNGKISLLDCTLIEDNCDFFYYDDDTASVDSGQSIVSTSSSLFSSSQDKQVDYNGLDFRIIVDSKSGASPPVHITLVASSLQEKAAWCSDISQCIENLRLYSDLANSSMSDISSVTMPQSVRYRASTSQQQHVSSSFHTSFATLRTKRMQTSSRVTQSATTSVISAASAGATLASHSSNATLLAAMIKRSDPKLFRDDIDIKFSRTLNSCKVPQIRHASVDRLLDRLTDLRFLSIDFLNTFLLTYRVFTTGENVLNALRRVYKNPECGNMETSGGGTHAAGGSQQEVVHRHSFDTDFLTKNSPSPPRTEFTGSPPVNGRHLMKPQEKVRRISTGSMKIEVTGDKSPILYTKHANGLLGDSSTDAAPSRTSTGPVPQPTSLLIPPKPKLAPIASCETLSEFDPPEVCDSPEDLSPPGTAGAGSSDSSSDETYTTTAAITVPTPATLKLSTSALGPKTTQVTFSHHRGPAGSESSTDDFDEECRRFNSLHVPCTTISSGVSSETLTSPNGSGGAFGLSPGGMTSAASSDTLVPCSPGFVSPLSSPKLTSSPQHHRYFRKALPIKIPTSHQLDALALSPATSTKFKRPIPASGARCRVTSPGAVVGGRRPATTSPTTVFVGLGGVGMTPNKSGKTSSVGVASSPGNSPLESPSLLKRVPSPISYSFSSPNIITNLKSKAGKRGSGESDAGYCSTTARSSLASCEGSPPAAKPGTVVTSSRLSKRRSSSTAATQAFAAATAGSQANLEHGGKAVTRYHPEDAKRGSTVSLNRKRESAISTAATMRVLNVLRHWVSKHSQDFESSPELRDLVKDMLEDMACNHMLCPAEHKAAATILRVLTKETEISKQKTDLTQLLLPPTSPTKDTFDSLSALDIAEQLTYLDHQIFMAIRSEELLCQAWMKPNKAHKAPQVLLVSKRFNEVSRLVVSEVVSRNTLQDRVTCIEKWAAIADICRCMHNYNGVLQICAAFVNASVYRLKKTWEKVSKQTKQMIEKLQTLVSSESRFKNMRDALHRCDPPCIPYLGMYLTDLSFIEEGTPALTEEGLVNFSKMRMVAHVIREIQHFQQTSYRIEHHKRVTNYILDPSRLFDDDATYRASLEIEPRPSRASVTGQSND